jgi:hypothetical protein
MCNLTSGPPAGKGPGDLVDRREQLWNEGLTGPAGLIQVPTERITRLRGILLDLDPAKLIAENPWFPPADDPVEFHAKKVEAGVKAGMPDRRARARLLSATRQPCVSLTTPRTREGRAAHAPWPESDGPSLGTSRGAR